MGLLFLTVGVADLLTDLNHTSVLQNHQTNNYISNNNLNMSLCCLKWSFSASVTNISLKQPQICLKSVLSTSDCFSLRADHLINNKSD